MKNNLGYKNSLIILLTIGLYLYAMVISAWLSDDSLISLTQIVNFHNGDGLVYNFNERVQAFTHPTWFFLLSLITYITNDYYNTIIFVSITASILAIVVIIYYAYKHNNILASTIGLSMLLFSKAFIDYTSSGLENPLSYLLFALLLYVLLTKKDLDKSNASILSIYMLMVFLFLNRMDYALILFPVAIVMLYNYKMKNMKPLFIAGSILVVWFLFSLFYFGHFFPNTFYAKLEAGYGANDFAQRGLQYFQVQYNEDPITLFIIAIGIIMGLLQKNIMSAFSIGLIFYLLYFFKSGGDFMQGRFFAVPAFIATFTIIIYFIERKIHFFIYLMAIAIVYLSLNTKSPLFIGKEYIDVRFNMGIADERGVYFASYGLISSKRNWPNIVTLNENIPKEVKITCGGLGASGLSSRNTKFHIDVCALTDPLLSQLPAIDYNNWRIGHQVRNIPTNYFLAVIDNLIPLEDEKVHVLYQDVKSVSRGDLFSKSRLEAIYRLNTKYYDINTTLYKKYNDKWKIYSDKKLYDFLSRKRPSISINKVDLSTDVTPGIPWNAKQCHIFHNDGISIIFLNKVEANQIKIGLDNNDEYAILFYNKGKLIEGNRVKMKFTEKGGLSTREIKFKKTIIFDKIDIFPINGDTGYSIGYINYE